jgi:hypothetical protein
MTLKLEITGHKCFEDRRDDMSIDLKIFFNEWTPATSKVIRMGDQVTNSTVKPLR